MSFHLITHAVCMAVIATLVRKYLHIGYQLEELEMKYESCMDHIEGKSSRYSKQNIVSVDVDEKNRVPNVENFPDGETVVHGLDENIHDFDASREVEYFDDYLGTKSQDDGSFGNIDDYTGTQFTQQTMAGTQVSKANTADIQPSTTKVKNQGVHQSDHVFESMVNKRSPGSNEDNLKGIYTSVWCHGSTVKDRICHFQNLCYHTVHKDFIYFHSKDSVEENLLLNTDSQNILDMSSVVDHNSHYFSLIKLPRETLNNFTTHWVNDKSLIFNRFKPDNIMHVIHDDILPIFQTLKQISFNENSKLLQENDTFRKLDFQLVSLEGWEEEQEFEFLYELFSKHKMLNQQSLAKKSELVCFADVHVGISKSTTWYQYGFYRPQGRLKDVTVTSQHIHDATMFILSQINNECPFCTGSPYMVLFSRKDTRLIINEMELSVAIAQNIGMKVLSVSMETHSLQDIMNIVHHSKGVIGMHGSLLIMSAFLQPGSVLIELFPFAINPSHYTPYKTLAELPNMDIVYKVWANQNEESTQMHPDWTPELGGIYHLTNQQEIMNQKEVPQHLCCDDPSWLFHIYQDTIVDIPAVINLIKSAFLKQSTNPETISSQTLVPGSIRNLKCFSDKTKATVKWKIPWSVQYLGHKSVSYELWFHNVQSNKTASFILPNVTSHVVSSILENTSYLVWVRCKLDNNVGPFGQSVKCKSV